MHNTIQHPFLGELVQTDGGIDYVGALKIGDQQIRLAIISEVDPLADILVRAEVSLRHIEVTRKQCFQYAAESLLESHNESWNEQDPISSEEFIEKITLNEVTIYHDGSAELFFLDGDLFWGHAIIVSMDENLTLNDASIAG